mgnify:CR=1 FL=1
MNYLRGIWRFLCIIALIPFLFVLAAYFFPKTQEERYRELVQTWARRLLACMGLRVVLKGEFPAYPAPGEKGYLLLCNHTSFLDIFAVDSFFCSRFVAKAEIGKWPLLGAIARGVRTIFIDRGYKRGILGILEQMESVLKKGENVIFFPEGTTSPGDRLLPLHSNLFEAAVATNAVIQPVVVRYTTDGEPTTHMAYTGNISIFQCLWNIVTTPDAAIEVQVLPTIKGDGRNRHELCEEASRVMSKALGAS